MSAREVKLTIEVGEPAVGINARHATLRLDGITIYSAAVYDTEQGGKRTAAAAERNLLLMFGERMKKLLAEDGDE